ncbi:MAG: glycosyltransferase family protein [Limisphaerales bacterium]
MRILLTVQGDGRGHMTQAIASSQALERHGHEVVGVTIGTNSSRSIPDFFWQAFSDRLTPLASPGFSFRGGRAVATVGTLRQLVMGSGMYWQSIRTLGTLIEKLQPDLILNFLEPLVGIFNLLRPHRVAVISVGHHFMVDHPAFVQSRKFIVQQWAMRRYVRLSGAGSTKLALSFYPAESLPAQRLFVCPPLLRQELF